MLDLNLTPEAKKTLMRYQMALQQEYFDDLLEALRETYGTEEKISEYSIAARAEHLIKHPQMQLF